MVGNRRAVGEREHRLHGRIVAERPVGRAPAPRVHLVDLAAGDEADEVDVVHRHVQEVRVRHPAAPVARRDPRVPQVAPAVAADPEQPAERPAAHELTQRERLPAEAVVLRHHRDAPRTARRLGDRLRVGERRRERLLDHDVAAGRKRLLGQPPVRRTAATRARPARAARHGAPGRAREHRHAEPRSPLPRGRARVDDRRQPEPGARATSSAQLSPHNPSPTCTTESGSRPGESGTQRRVHELVGGDGVLAHLRLAQLRVVDPRRHRRR